MPVFAFYFLLSCNKAAAPNWDALAFVSFGLLAIGYWREKLERQLGLQRLFAAALIIGIANERGRARYGFDSQCGRRTSARSSEQLRGWKSATEAIEKVRTDIETQLGQPVFLIADERDRASEISFYLKDKRVGRPGTSASLHRRIAGYAEPIFLLAALR